MNYQRIYDQIIERAKLENRKKGKGIYYEKHHIVMRSMGGTNDASNLILLTAKEHFIAHRLLWKIHNNKATAYAFYALCHFRTENRPKINSSYAYQEAKEMNSLILSQKRKNEKLTDEWKENLSKAGKKRFSKKSERKKTSDANSLRYRDPIERKKQSDGNLKSHQEDPTRRERQGISLANAYVKSPTLRKRQTTSQKKRRARERKLNIVPIGDKTSQYGTCWIKNEMETKKIKKEELQSYLDNGWKRGRNQWIKR